MLQPVGLFYDPLSEISHLFRSLVFTQPTTTTFIHLHSDIIINLWSSSNRRTTNVMMMMMMNNGSDMIRLPSFTTVAVQPDAVET